VELIPVGVLELPVLYFAARINCTTIPAGVLELPVLYFAARINCTTVVGHGGLQVLQLWKD
jgi:hypothetical protein